MENDKSLKDQISEVNNKKEERKDKLEEKDKLEKEEKEDIYLKKKVLDDKLNELLEEKEEKEEEEEEEEEEKAFSDISTTISVDSSEINNDYNDDYNETIIVDETKQKCECLGCVCKKTDKKKGEEFKYEEPVYTDCDEKNAPDNAWTSQRKHHFQKCLWKLKYNRVVTNVYLNNLKKEEDDWSWRLICLSTFTSGLTVANNVEEEPWENYDICVNGALTFMSMLTSVCAAWLKKKNFVEKINEIDKYVLMVNRICEELDVQFSILDTDRLKYGDFKDKYKEEITSILSASPIIPPDEWKKSIQEITLKYPELINPDNSEDNKLWPWFGDMVYQDVIEKGKRKRIKVRKKTAFMDQMRSTRTHRLKSSCCFNKRDEKDIYN